MTRIRITKLERHERGFFSANVTADGGDTVRVDDSIGCWTLPVDPRVPLGARCERREILPHIAKSLIERTRKFLRGEAADEGDHEIDARAGGGGSNVRPTPKDEPPAPTDIAEKMAQAGLAAVKRAA